MRGPQDAWPRMTSTGSVWEWLRQHRGPRRPGSALVEVTGT